MAVSKPLWSATVGSLAAALAAWTSFGPLTGVDPLSANQRVGLLPPLGWLGLLSAASVLFVLRPQPARHRWPVLALSGLVLIPWLPIRIPTVALAWTGHLRVWLWITIAAIIAIRAVRHAGPQTAIAL